MLFIPPPGTPSRAEIQHVRVRVGQGHLYLQRWPSRGRRRPPDVRAASTCGHEKKNINPLCGFLHHRNADAELLTNPSLLPSSGSGLS